MSEYLMQNYLNLNRIVIRFCFHAVKMVDSIVLHLWYFYKSRMQHNFYSCMLAFDSEGARVLWSSLNMSCIKISNQFVDYVAFIISISIIFCFLKLKRYEDTTIKWKSLIVNLSIEFIYLTLLLNLGLIIEAIDHLAKTVESKLQNLYRVFIVTDCFSSFLKGTRSHIQNQKLNASWNSN